MKVFYTHTSGQAVLTVNTGHIVRISSVSVQEFTVSVWEVIVQLQVCVQFAPMMYLYLGTFRRIYHLSVGRQSKYKAFAAQISYFHFRHTLSGSFLFQNLNL